MILKEFQKKKCRVKKIYSVKWQKKNEFETNSFNDERTRTDLY